VSVCTSVLSRNRETHLQALVQVDVLKLLLVESPLLGHRVEEVYQRLAGFVFELGQFVVLDLFPTIHRFVCTSFTSLNACLVGYSVG
jgi:hypothetical protein